MTVAEVSWHELDKLPNCFKPWAQMKFMCQPLLKYYIVFEVPTYRFMKVSSDQTSNTTSKNNPTLCGWTLSGSLGGLRSLRLEDGDKFEDEA